MIFFIKKNKFNVLPSSSESLKTARFLRIGDPLWCDAALPLRFDARLPLRERDERERERERERDRDRDRDRDRESMENNKIKQSD